MLWRRWPQLRRAEVELLLRRQRPADLPLHWPGVLRLVLRTGLRMRRLLRARLRMQRALWLQRLLRTLPEQLPPSALLLERLRLLLGLRLHCWLVQLMLRLQRL